VHYTRVSPGTGVQNAVLEHSTTPSVFFKSRIQRGGEGWELTLKDGTVYVFEGAVGSLLLQSVRNRAGNRITLARQRDEHGKVTTVTSPNGRWLRLTFDVNNISGRITQIQDNAGRVVNYGYNDRGLLASVTDPAGSVTAYTYDSSHRMLTATDATGSVFLRNSYDDGGRVIEQTQADGGTYQFAYALDTNGRIIRTDVTDPRANTRRVTFNSDGYMVTDTRALGTPEEQTTTYEREPVTNLVRSVTDSVGRKTAYDYDPVGSVTAITRLAGTPEAVTVSFAYEPRFAQLESVTA
jgi:YD repeat-containing protein